MAGIIDASIDQAQETGTKSRQERIVLQHWGVDWAEVL